MKVLNLIIANFQPGVYEQLVTQWRRYMNVDPDVRSLFLVFDPALKTDYVLTEDTMTLKGTDSYVPGIYDKSIRSMKICLSLPEFSDVKYVIRSNLSSFWIWSRLHTFLQTAPDTKYIASGHIMDVYGYLAPQGSNIIMSRDVALSFSNELHHPEKSLPDDVVFGVLCKKYGIHIQKYDWCVSTHIIRPSQYPSFIETIAPNIFTIRNNLLDPDDRVRYEGVKYKILVDTFYT